MITMADPISCDLLRTQRPVSESGDGTFEDATERASLPVTGVRYGSGCSFVDYDRDGYFDLFVANYVDLDLEKTPLRARANFVYGSASRHVRAARLALAHNVLYHNNHDGTFTDVSESAGIFKPGGRYGLGVSLPTSITMAGPISTSPVI